jgi:hypothetical protein
MTPPYPQRRVFASTFTYPYTKLRGKQWVIEALNAGDGFPAAETLSELRSALFDEPFSLYADGATLITRARSVAAGEFLRDTAADVWLTFDDDAFVPKATLLAVIEAARATRSLVGVPAINRLSDKPNYTVHGGTWKPERVRTEGALKLCRVHYVSFTCVAIHRMVIETLACPQSMVTLDTDHKPYPALFLERIHQGAWVGEDVAFCMMMRESFLPCYLLLEHPMTHAGVGCMVDAEGSVLLDSATAKKLQAAAEELAADDQGGSK